MRADFGGSEWIIQALVRVYRGSQRVFRSLQGFTMVYRGLQGFNKG